MKRFVIATKRTGDYKIPVMETREFTSPKRLGSYCAEDGSLWTSLNDGVRIFEFETDARDKLNEVRQLLFDQCGPAPWITDLVPDNERRVEVRLANGTSESRWLGSHVDRWDTACAVYGWREIDHVENLSDIPNWEDLPEQPQRPITK